MQVELALRRSRGFRLDTGQSSTAWPGVSARRQQLLRIAAEPTRNEWTLNNKERQIRKSHLNCNKSFASNHLLPLQVEGHHKEAAGRKAQRFSSLQRFTLQSLLSPAVLNRKHKDDSQPAHAIIRSLLTLSKLVVLPGTYANKEHETSPLVS